MVDATQARIAQRLKAKREQMGLSQEALAGRSGFKHRQTVTAIEAGERSISSAELASLAEALDVGVTYFTDRFVSTGEAAFSFRAEDAGAGVAAFEDLAGQWIATYAELAERRGAKPSLLLPALSLTPRSRFEDALVAAEDVREALGLGQYPADELEVALERDWSIPVLYFDAQPGISGAASRFGGLQVIFINRSESPGRRNFDLAHELFHLLTWDSMPPRRIDDARPVRLEKRVEQLANDFASALLMPKATLHELWEHRPEGALHEWVALVAGRLGVSGPALKWRLLNLALVDKDDLPTDEAISEASDGSEVYGPTPQLFSATFVERVHTAVESGVLSLRKASHILGLNTREFADLCRSYGRQLSYEV
jgi:Zn-dependent peptidase ImmA (M78 family)/DNA-binding XRE family transcriptional regulator